MLPSERYKEITGQSYVYNIMPIANIPSVMQHGIICFNEADRIEHYSIAMDPVQERRAKVRMPNGKTLHDYANLYFSFWNPMLSRRRNENNNLCILAVRSTVLDLAGCVVTDRNASVGVARFFSPEIGIERIDFDKVHSQYWTHPDDIYKESEHKKIKCAEILLPDVVPLRYIAGAYVCSNVARQKLIQSGFTQKILVRPDNFFH